VVEGGRYRATSLAFAAPSLKEPLARPPDHKCIPSRIPSAEHVPQNLSKGRLLFTIADVI
jgi:hypothetical protein